MGLLVSYYILCLYDLSANLQNKSYKHLRFRLHISIVIDATRIEYQSIESILLLEK